MEAELTRWVDGEKSLGDIELYSRQCPCGNGGCLVGAFAA